MRKHFCPKTAFAGILVCFSLSVLVSAQGDESRKKTESSKKKTEDKTDEKKKKPFAHVVRKVFFAGFAGDDKALKKGMTICEETLAKNPKHAEALAWRGAGRLFLSGKSFQSGDVDAGMIKWESGIKDLDKAKELEPDNIAVLIPRAASLMGAGRNSRRNIG